MSSGIEDPPNTTHYRVRVHDDGPALWPQYIGLDKLAEAHEDVGTPIYETMYQGRRGGLAGQIIREEFFHYYRGEPPGLTYMAVDPAISLKTTADETAIAIGNVKLDDHLTVVGTQVDAFGVRSEIAIRRGSVYLRWIWHGRIGLKDQEDVIAKAWAYYRPVAVGIEAVAYQSALVQLLENDHPELPIEPVTPDKDKLTRFLGLARLYEFGRIFHHPELAKSAAEYQLTHLPNGRHDDIADAIVYLVQMGGITSGTIVSDTRPPGFR